MIGKRVTVIVDRPLGSHHPKFKDMIYPVNYGYVPGILAGDGEEQDAYIVGIDIPVQEFEGEIIAIVNRKNDNEDKWVVAPAGSVFSKEEISHFVHFTEQYFDSEIIM